MKVSDLIMIASEVSGFTVMEIKGACRARPIALVRFAVYIVARKGLGLSYPVIGAAIGDRDHTTVMYGVDRALYGYRNEAVYRALMEAVGE